MLAVDSTVPDARAVLHDVFGHAEFRGGQERAVEAVLAGRDAIVLLPTGAGKSLCYQVPATVLFRAGRGTTVVVSPLIALMNDQVGALRGRGIAAAAIHSQQDDDDQRAVFGEFVRGELALLYVSPERVALDSFRRLLARVPIALFAIDEAHCLSQWGHDFRPEYLRLHELRELAATAHVPVIALTATATPRVLTEIAAALELVAPTIVRGDFQRPNLRFEVRHLAADRDRLAATLAACDEVGLRSRIGTGRAIIYCSTRKKAETVAEALRASGFPAGYYHAGRTALARERAQDAFAMGKLRVLVATSAFGMGVDHPDVRLIVHFQTPGSLEAYYQEAGRAGRDGQPARCLMLFGASDLMTQRKLARGGDASDLRVEEMIASIERYARTRRCRQVMLCAHFTGTDEHAACGHCDACAAPGDEGGDAAAAPEAPAAALGDDARRVILEAVAGLRKPVGKGALAKALRGSQAKAVTAHSLHTLPQHGALIAASEAEVAATIEALIGERKLVRRGQKYPTVWLPGRPTRPGRAAIDGAAPRVSRSGPSGLARALETFRRTKARELQWKSYMIFQRRTIAALDQARPTSELQLARIPGLGPAKIARFGPALLELIRRHGD
jgi:ATP-dependent DNA helicase RecQ